MHVDFKFSINQKVETHLGDIGVIDGVSKWTGDIIKYSVQLKGGKEAWFDEAQLTSTK